MIAVATAPQARLWGITGHYRPPDAWFSHVQRKMGAGQGAYRPVDTCLDERIPGLYFLSKRFNVSRAVEYSYNVNTIFFW